MRAMLGSTLKCVSWFSAIALMFGLAACGGGGGGDTTTSTGGTGGGGGGGTTVTTSSIELPTSVEVVSAK